MVYTLYINPRAYKCWLNVDQFKYYKSGRSASIEINY